MKKTKNDRANSITFGIISGLGILILYITVLTLFEDFNFAISQFKSLWYWLVPLATGFGTQIGLMTSLNNACAKTTSSISGGSMILCCSHFILNILPITGLAGAAMFLMTYQKWIFGVGIISNFIGISLVINHKRKMTGKKSFINKKFFIYAGIFVVLFLLLIGSISSINQSSFSNNAVSSSNGGDDYQNLPEKCRPAPGYSIEDWKEHLSHHKNTQDCLQYFS